MPHYNTTAETGQQLDLFSRQANKQESLILSIMQQAKKPLSPSWVEKYLLQRGYSYPLTSIRRAMTDLTIAGKLVKTSIKTVGKFGMPEYVWTLNNSIL